MHEMGQRTQEPEPEPPFAEFDTVVELECNALFDAVEEAVVAADASG